MNALLERDIQAQCLQYLSLIGCLVWRQNQGSLFASSNGKTRRIRFASIEGISDIIGCTPTGRLLAIEVKRPGNHPTSHQQAFLDAVNRVGGLGIVVRSVDDLICELREQGVIE